VVVHLASLRLRRGEMGSDASVVVLGIDPGFAELGYAAVEIKSLGVPLVLCMGVIRTEKSDKKLRVLSSDDNMRRAREIHKELRDIVQTMRPKALCVESKSFPRNAASSAKIAMCWGVMAALSNDFDLPVIQVSPKAMKKAVDGTATATKEDVAEALNQRFGRDLAKECLECKKIPRSLYEHAFDALGVVVASLDSEILRMVRRLAE
jgi:crossover junction endodeoxyribonuclease RuvC